MTNSDGCRLKPKMRIQFWFPPMFVPSGVSAVSSWSPTAPKKTTGAIRGSQAVLRRVASASMPPAPTNATTACVVKSPYGLPATPASTLEETAP